MLRKVLITGGAGYIGSTVAGQLIRAGYSVRVLDSLMHGGVSLLSLWGQREFEFIKGDIRDRRVTRSAISGVDALIHMAAVVGDPACARQPDEARAVNLDASIELLEDSRSAGVQQFVFASTCSNYGRMKDPTAYVDEESALDPLSLYAETKVAFERALLDPSSTDGLCATPLRFATVYGVSPRMRFDLTVNEFTRDMLIKKHLVVFGEQFWRPYVHVQDVAKAVVEVLVAPKEKVANRVFNVGATSENYQKVQLVELIRKHAPEANVEYVHRQEDPRDYRVSFERIRSELGFAPQYTVPDGISEVVRLVRDKVIKDFDDPSYKN